MLFYSKSSLCHTALSVVCLLFGHSLRAESPGGAANEAFGAGGAAALARAEAFLEKKFKELDKDGDGRLSVEEARPAEQWLRGADANHDGFLTLEEVRNHLRARMGELLAARRGPAEPLTPASETPAPAYAAKDSPREEPRVLPLAESGVGAFVPDAALTDLGGKARHLREVEGTQCTVLALMSPSCPVSKRYLPSLSRLAQEFQPRGASFVLLASSATDTAQDLQGACTAAGLKPPCFREGAPALLSALGARSSTEVFVLDAGHTVIYRGAIDDQYGLGYSRETPRRNYLADALRAALRQEPPAIAATEAPGCLLDLGAAVAQTDLTYHNRISRLVQAHCLECHHAGGVAPFALETYEQVSAKSGMIRKMVERRLMPPWFAAPAPAGQHSPWGNDRSLGEKDRADFLAWLAAGRPIGDAKDAPLPRTFATGWAIGHPDAVVQIPRPMEVKAEGVMPYQGVTVETNFGEDKWVRGLEIQPTAREVVHHVLVFVQAPAGLATIGRGGRFAGEQDEREGFFAAYVPGNSHVLYPEGLGKLLPAGAKLRFQIHYTPNGTATHDQVKLGLVFADKAPEHIVRVVGVSDHRISIPPGAARHPQTAILPVPADAMLLAFTPHMHLRGTAFRFEALPADGTVNTLLDVPHYDFNWQLSYRCAEPLMLPAGTKIRATGWFDNSANNPANPDPANTVHWGPQTYEEMMLGYVEYYLPNEQPAAKTAAR